MWEYEYTNTPSSRYPLSSSYILSPRLAARDDKQKDMTLAPKNAPSPLEKTDKKIQGQKVVLWQRCAKQARGKVHRRGMWVESWQA